MEHTKFENNYDCDCQFLIRIPFLDTQCKIENGKIIVDLYREVFLESDDNWNFRHFFLAKNVFYILCIYGLYPNKNFGVL